MNFKISIKSIYIIAIISIFTLTSCDVFDDVNDSIDETIDEMLGISALSEDLNATSTSYSDILNIVINNQSISSSETKMKLPSIVSIAYNKKKYSLTNSMWTITTTPYSSTIPKSMFNKQSNVVKIVVQNNTPSVYVNNIIVSDGGSGGSGGGGTGGGTGTTTKLLETTISGSLYQLKVVSFTVPTGVKSMVVKTDEAESYYRNLADLFVRKGSAPIVSKTSTTAYTWTADYTSRTANREQDICTISNPASGTWYVGLFGYSSDFQSRLTVTVTK